MAPSPSQSPIMSSQADYPEMVGGGFAGGIGGGPRFEDIANEIAGIEARNPKYNVSVPSFNKGLTTFRPEDQPFAGGMLGGSFKGRPGSGSVSSGTQVFNRYDPETDTYHGTIGGIAGNSPFSVPGSQVNEEFKSNFAAANEGYDPNMSQYQLRDGEYVSVPKGMPLKEFLQNRSLENSTSGSMPSPTPQKQVQKEQPAAPKAPTPPINIMGPSFDPNERKEYEEKIRAQMSLMPGQNIISQNPVTMNPLSAVPQTQFGGYGAQMPMKALNPYAGMGAANKKVDFFPDYVDAPPKIT